MSALAQLFDFRARLGWIDTENDALALQILTTASAKAEELTGRPLRRQTGVVEFPDKGLDYAAGFRLAMYPVERIVSVKQLTYAGGDADFAAAAALVEGIDYRVDKRTGWVRRIGLRWCLKPGYLRIEYDAGYLDPTPPDESEPDEEWPPEGAVLPPENLQDGVLQHAIRIWDTKDKAGVREIDMGQEGGRVSFTECKPHPALVDACTKLQLPP